MVKYREEGDINDDGSKTRTNIQYGPLELEFSQPNFSFWGLLEECPVMVFCYDIFCLINQFNLTLYLYSISAPLIRILGYLPSVI